MRYNSPYGTTDPEATYGSQPYVNGNPSTGQMGSIPPAASIEYPQREIANLITDANLAAPSNSDLHQLAKAVQSGLLNSKDDSGTANAYSVTLVPAPTAYFKYMRIVMKVLNTNSGASVINVNALGNKPIVNKDLSALNPGQMIINALVELVYDGTQFQLVWAGNVATGTGGGVLTANTNLYVNTATGNDTTLDGTAATITGSKGPFKTIQRAVNEAFKYQPSASYTMTINTADGTYNEGVASASVAGPSIILKGNAATPANVSVVAPTNQSAISVSGPNTWTVRDLKFTAASANTAGIGANGSGANVTVINTESGACGSWVFLGNGLGAIQLAGAHKFTASAVNAFAAYRNGTINFGSGFAITISAAITVTQFALANSGGQIEVTAASPPTFVNPGNVTGAKYLANLNGVINSQGNGTSYFPGTVAGSISNGGQYG